MYVRAWHSCFNTVSFLVPIFWYKAISLSKFSHALFPHMRRFLVLIDLLGKKEFGDVAICEQSRRTK